MYILHAENVVVIVLVVLFFLSSRWLSGAHEASTSFGLDWTDLMESFRASWGFISPSRATIVRTRGWRARVKSHGRSTLPAAAEPTEWLTAAGGRCLFRCVTTPGSPDALPACAFTNPFPLLLLFKSEGHDVMKCFEPVGEVQCKRLQTGSWITSEFCNYSQESIHNQSL